MSSGFDRDDNHRVEKPEIQRRMNLSRSRAGGGETENDPADRRQGNDPARADRQPLHHEREEVRYGRRRSDWNSAEQAVIREVGRFRTLDEEDVKRIFYRLNPTHSRADRDHLSKPGLLLRRSVSVGKNGPVRRSVVLSKRAKRLSFHHHLAAEGHAVYAGFVKPAEVSRDASIYKMHEGEAVEILASGGRVNYVVLDFEFKREIDGELNKNGDYGDLGYARRQDDLAQRATRKSGGKINLPDLRIEYETADGEHAQIDLELATENYRPAHMNLKPRAGFKIYGVNSTSRDRRAEVGRSRTDGGGTGLMSAPQLSLDERIANVQRLGYAHAEAEFLALVALHGGYFVRRQFDAWIGVERGKRSEDFLADLLDRGHCRRQIFAHNRPVFHLRFRPLYRAVGDEHSRNRRDHQPQAIKTRLMTLISCWLIQKTSTSQPNARRLRICAVSAESIPRRSRRRYFAVELEPPQRAAVSSIAFLSSPVPASKSWCSYVDSGFETSGPFAAHLRRYLPLFAELSSFELVYATNASTRLGQEQSVFERVLSRGRKWLTKTADPERLIAHLRDRQLFERRETSGFDRDRLDRLRDDMETFSGSNFAQMFACWQIFGDEAIRAEIAAQKMPNGRFSTCILPHDYDLFGRVEEAS